MLVTAVGVNSEWGRTMALVVGETADTPLQEALTVLAAAVGKVGLFVGVLCFVVLLIRWIVENKGFPVALFAEGPLRFFIFAVTIVVVAVPEGLPLAVTISLAYSMRKMMKDNNFVVRREGWGGGGGRRRGHGRGAWRSGGRGQTHPRRAPRRPPTTPPHSFTLFLQRVLAACETMGGATAICSDKTGTLTENRMTVVAARLGGHDAALARPPPGRAALHPALAEAIELNCALNSKAFLVHKPDGSTDFVGNRTECALLMLLKEWGTDYKALRDDWEDRVVREYDFSSERKMASVLVHDGAGNHTLYAKARTGTWMEDDGGGRGC